MEVVEVLSFIFVAALLLLWWRFYEVSYPALGKARQAMRLLAMSEVFATGVHAPDATLAGERALDEVLGRIQRAGGFRHADGFVAEAKQAYELIVAAFAAGNLDRVAERLTDGVREDFGRFIATRRQRAETETLTFIGFRAAEIVDAGIEAGTSWIEVRFVADLVSSTRDASGTIIAGHPERVAQCSELWTFELHAGWNGRSWRLSATDADA